MTPPLFVALLILLTSATGITLVVAHLERYWKLMPKARRPRIKDFARDTAAAPENRP